MWKTAGAVIATVFLLAALALALMPLWMVIFVGEGKSQW